MPPQFTTSRPHSLRPPNLAPIYGSQGFFIFFLSLSFFYFSLLSSPFFSGSRSPVASSPAASPRDPVRRPGVLRASGLAAATRAEYIGAGGVGARRGDGSAAGGGFGGRRSVQQGSRPEAEPIRRSSRGSRRCSSRTIRRPREARRPW